MTRFFILFLIALLPLRGWTAERMVFVMEPNPVTVSSPGMESNMADECALHRGLDLGNMHHEAATGHGAHHKSCESCQLCMPVVALDAPTVLAAAVLPAVVPVPRTSNFVSADPARDVKPPIS